MRTAPLTCRATGAPEASVRTMAIQLLTLGRLAVLVDGVERRSFLAQPIRTAVLLYLAFERETTRESTMAVFWPDRAPDAARHALSQTLHKLRRVLGYEWIEARGESLRVAPWVMVDAGDFERAVERGETASALELYEGEFLSGWHLANVREFEDWVDRRRWHLSRLYREAARRGVTEWLAAGELEKAAEVARHWVDLDPLEAEAQRTLLELLGRQGRVDEAICQYDRYVRAMAVEELEPPEELAALISDIRSTGPRLSLPPPPLPPLLPEPAFDSPSAARPRLGSRFRNRGARLLALALGAAAALIVVNRSILRSPEPSAPTQRVLVLPLRNATGDPALDPLAIMAADWIAQGVARSGVAGVVPVVDALGVIRGDGLRDDPATEVVRARELAATTSAGTLVTGSYARAGDGLRFRAQVVSVANGTLLGAVESVAGTADAPLEAIDLLRDRVLGILSARLDARSAVAQGGFEAGIPPPTYPAYRAYTTGVEHFLQLEYAKAIPHLLKAAELDSSFNRSLLVAAAAFRSLGDYASEDSLVAHLESRASDLTPYEAGALAWHQARLRYDPVALLRIGREASESYPGTIGHFVAGVDALELNLPRLALRYFDDLDPQNGWRRDFFPLWESIASAHHSLGDHQMELRTARLARSRFPASACPLLLEVRALAALGRFAEVEVVVTRSLMMTPQAACSPGDVILSAAHELRAHDRRREAHQVATLAVAWYRSRPIDAAATEQHRAALARALYISDRLEETRALFTELSRDFPGNVEYLGRIGVVAARRGDRAEAERVDRVLAEVEGTYQYGAHKAWRARIAAHLGAPERAVVLLREAFSEGLLWTTELHADPDLEPLRTYPAFQRLMETRG